MAISSTYAQYGLASTETDTISGNSFSARVGTASTRKLMPLADIGYTIDIEFDGSGDAVTINLDNGTATGDVTGVKASGTITFTGLPTATQTVTVNGTVYTFVAASSSDTEITIGANITEMASNTVSIITANDSLIDAISAVGVVTVSAAETGEYGNAYTLAETASNTTVSGATLSGGVDKVIITGDGVDYLGAALATAALIHGVQVLCTAGSVTLSLTTLLKDTVTPNGGFQTWSTPGRSDLLENLVITSGAANTVAQVVVRASE